MAESEVARLRQQIERECQAMTLGLSGYALTAKHEIISHKYDRLGAHCERLSQIIGERSALEVVIEALNKTARK